jgi:hypothetical protein
MYYMQWLYIVFHKKFLFGFGFGFGTYLASLFVCSVASLVQSLFA